MNQMSYYFSTARQNGAGSKNRTRDLMITNQLLYRLSYTSETDVG
jgi:hypothetical protein